MIGAFLDALLRSEFAARLNGTPLERPRYDPASTGESRRRATVLASLVLAVASGVCAMAFVFFTGGGVDSYLVVAATTLPAAAFSGMVYLDHDNVRGSFSVLRPSTILLQGSYFLAVGSTIFTWTVHSPVLICSILLAFPLMLWGWMLEVGMGLATPLRLPGTFAAVSLGLARRLAVRVIGGGLSLVCLFV